ncbi:MAG: hypothetical protein ACLFQK_01075 [Fibrobacterota bacterium]
MRTTRTALLGSWTLIILNILMAFGAIWVFSRMSPAIEKIIRQNEHSLHACEDMLANLAFASSGEEHRKKSRVSFEKALERASGNITEEGEYSKIKEISEYYLSAFEGNRKSIEKTVYSVKSLSQINRTAMKKADTNAQEFGNAGAWVIVFMASGTFIVGMIFLQNIGKNLINPLNEIHSVITEFNKGDTKRRCSYPDVPEETQLLFNEINKILDEYKEPSV